MKKRFSQILCVGLASVVVAGGVLSSCTDEEETVNNTGSTVEYTDFRLADKGRSDYTVVLPEKASDLESFAAEELVRLFKEATGVELPVVSDSGLTFDENAKYISIGETTLKEDSGLQTEFATLKSSGGRIVNNGSCVFLAGAAEYGTLYAVYDFLGYLFDYEYFDIDAYRLVKKDVVRLPVMDYTNIPDFEYRYFGDMLQYTAYGGDDNHAHRLRIRDLEGNSALSGHTANSLIDPNVYGDKHRDWYGENDGLKYNADGTYNTTTSFLCYSNEEMTQEYIKNVKSYLQKSPTADSIALTQADFNDWCNCDKCAAATKKYGNGKTSLGAVTQTLFLHKVVPAVNEWLAEEYPGRKVYYKVYAYHQTIDPPAHKDATGKYIPNGAENGDYSMVLPEDVFVVYANIYADRNVSWGDNPQVAEMIKGWGALTQSLTIYEYGQDALNVCMPYDGLQVHADNIRFAKSVGLNNNYRIQGNYVTMSSGFYYLRVYAATKLMWDSTLDPNQLAREYIETVYGEAAPYMQQMYDAMRLRMVELREKYNYGAMCLTDYVSSRNWPREVLLQYQELIDKAYAAIEHIRYVDEEKYEILVRKIKIEEMFVRYVNCSLYLNRMDTESKTAYIDAFETDAKLYGFKNWHESKPMSEKIAIWRNS